MNDVSISTHLIETSHLSKRYGNRFGLKDADLNVENHEIFALMGPNGAGKSTLLRILATLTRPTSGEVKIFGYDILKQEIQIRRLIGVVLHHSLLYDELSGRENLSFYMRLYGFRNKDILKKSIKDKASLFGVEDRLDDHVGTLSSGLKKRFDIVRAIIHNPRILLLDEPFSSLDLEGVEHLKNYLNWVKGSSTIIFSTHNLDIAEEISDRIATLKDSQITEIRCIK